MVERAPRKFEPINCAHCQKELVPISSSQKYHPDCRLEVKRTRRRERYHADPDFREKLLTEKRKSNKKHHEKLAARKLTGILETTTRWLDHFTNDPYPLFFVEGGMVMVARGRLLLKTKEFKAPIATRDAIEEYGYRYIKDAARKILTSDLRK